MKELNTIVSLFICRDIKAYVGEEGLFNLWKEAMTTFNKAVLEQNLDYNRFSEDFINSHIFQNVFDAITQNNHMVNVCRIKSLLYDRKDLIYKYQRQRLDYKIFSLCMKDFMFINSSSHSNSVNFECDLSERTLLLIVRAINDIPLFKRDVDCKDMDDLFNKCTSPEIPLIARNNGVLGYFFSCLNYRAVISRMYEYVISTHKLIRSSSGKKFLTQTDLSSALYVFECTDNPIKDKIQNWCIRIKDSILE